MTASSATVNPTKDANDTAGDVVDISDAAVIGTRFQLLMECNAVVADLASVGKHREAATIYRHSREWEKTLEALRCAVDNEHQLRQDDMSFWQMEALEWAKMHGEATDYCDWLLQRSWWQRLLNVRKCCVTGENYTDRRA